MRYSIGYLLSGKTKKFHEKKREELAKKFHEPYLLDNPIPAHSTLKYPFDATKTQIKQIEKLLKDFTKNNNSSDIKIRKINNFHKKVVFLQLDFSREAKTTFKKLVLELKKLHFLEWGEYDKTINGKFHATLVYGNTPKNFDLIWKYVSKIKPNLDLKFDNITILKKPKKYWKIYKVYKLK